MAAQPAKTSPSNQKMHQGEDNITAPSKNNQQQAPQLKDPPTMMKEAPANVQQQQQQQREAKEGNQSASTSAGAGTSTSTTGAGTPTIPTYFSSATSETYSLAKQLLNAGNFEEALSLIEQGLENTKTELRVRLSLTANTNDNDEELERSIEFNGSVAPFHYLYGTTLLYSLEEAKEDGQDNGGMTVENNSSINSASASAAAENNNTPMAQMLSSLSSDQGGGGGGAEQQEQQQPDVDFAEDIQIAWENLDLARNIIQKMIGEGNVLSETDVAKLQLDLAQIYLREGDLERINGNYSPSIEDYTSCLEILLQHNNTKDENNIERNLDRKIADTQFNLGLTYLTSSSDLQKQLAGDDGKGNDPAAAAAAPTPNNSANAAVLAKEHCEKGIQQHVECAKTFCRILATLFGVEPETILLKARQQVASEKSDTTAAASALAGFKTTGLYDDDFKSGTTAAIASQTLNALRMTVATMVSSHPPSDTESTDYVVSDIQQMLDEIQETVDESERSQEGVFQAAQIRVNAQKQAAALSDASSGGGATFTSVTNKDTGVITSIGFGPASTSSISINDANADTKTAAAKPMMVVKKKKKRKDVGDGEDSKPNATDDAKRAKTA